MNSWQSALPVLLHVLVLAGMGIGFIGLVIPIYPGLNIIWLFALLYAAIDGFAWPGWGFLLVLAVLAFLGNLSDNVFVGARARKVGAAWGSILFGYAAGIAGTFLFPPLGGIVGTFAGVLLAEKLRRKPWRAAWTTTREMAFGLGWSVLARLGVGALMILTWAAWALLRHA